MNRKFLSFALAAMLAVVLCVGFAPDAFAATSPFALDHGSSHMLAFAAAVSCARALVKESDALSEELSDYDEREEERKYAPLDGGDDEGGDVKHEADPPELLRKVARREGVNRQLARICSLAAQLRAALAQYASLTVEVNQLTFEIELLNDLLHGG